MSILPWVASGSFLLAKDGKRLLAKLPFFNEEFRDYAREQKGRWDGLEKAWVFLASKEGAVLEALQKMEPRILQAEQAKAQERQRAGEEAIAQMGAAPFSFHSPKLNIEYDAERLSFWVKFPYDPILGDALYRAKGRWRPDAKAYEVPVASLKPMLAATEAIRCAHELFEALNAPWLAAEAARPLRPPEAPDGFHRMEVKCLLDDRCYALLFPFPLGSPLGQRCIREPLAAAGLLAFDPRDCETAALARKVLPAGGRFEMRHRPMLEQAMAIVAASLETLGPQVKWTVPFERPGCPPLSKERRDLPMPGEVFFRDHQAWTIAHAKKAKENIVMACHPLDAAQAATVLASQGDLGGRRACELSGIAFESLPSYLEGLILREESRETRQASAPCKPMRL